MICYPLLLILILVGASKEKSPKTELAIVETDTLSKYSYLIYGSKPFKNYHVGTGFFIEHMGTTYLISAKHVFAGIDIKGESIPDYPDTLYIPLFNKKLNKVENYEIDIRKIKDTTLKSVKWYERPDYFVHKMNAPENYILHTINSNIKVPSRNDSLKNILGYGYATSQDYTINNPNLLKAVPFKGRLVFDIEMLISYTDQDSVIDYFNYAITLPTNRNFAGASGAPVFMYLEGKKEYGFTGIFIAENTDTQLGIVLRGIFIINEIRGRKGL